MLTKEQTLAELQIYYPTIASVSFDLINRRVVLWDRFDNRIDSLHIEAYKGFELTLYENAQEALYV